MLDLFLVFFLHIALRMLSSLSDGLYRDAEDSRRRPSSRGPNLSGREGVGAGGLPGWQGAQPADMMEDNFAVPMEPDAPAHSTATVFDQPRSSALAVGVDSTAAVGAGGRTITLNAAAQDQTEMPTTDFRVSWPGNINKNLNYWHRYLVM